MTVAVAEGELASVAASHAWRAAPHTFARMVTRGRWRPYAYQSYGGDRIAAAVSRGRGRLIFNGPPRHGKSDGFVFWPILWFLDNLPRLNVILASYGADLARIQGRRCRNELATNHDLMASLSEDSRDRGHWHTTEGGSLISCGVGGPVTGHGGDLIIIDDPHKNWREAHSHRMRAMVREWFTSTLYSRAEPDATIIVVQHRWHEEDLSGFLLEDHEDDWELHRFPALAEPADPLGRAPGEALCPERYDVPALQSIRKAVTRRPWGALFQQRPEVLGGGRVYLNFSSPLNVDPKLELVDRLPLHLSLDFNIDPGMHAIVGQWDNRADEFTTGHEIHEPRMNVGECMDAFERLVGGAAGWRWPELHIFGDATGKAEFAGTSESCYTIVDRKLKWLRAKGVTVRRRVKAANPPLRDSIDAFNDALLDTDEVVHYRIHPRCKRLIRDLRDLKPDDHGLIDKAEHALSHPSDAERYRVDYLRPLRLGLPLYGGRFSV